MDKPPFEELRQLAEDNPAEFEELRSELIEDLIQSSSHSQQRRLRGLQFVIDSKRDLAGNPIKAMIEIQSMMHDSLAELNQALHSLGQQSPPLSPSALHPQTSPNRGHNDNVIPLTKSETSRAL